MVCYSFTQTAEIAFLKTSSNLEIFFMRKPLTNKFLWILSLLIAFPLMSCADSVDKQGGSESNLVELIKQFSDQFAERSLTVKKMERYLAKTAEQSPSKKSWGLDSDKFQVRINARAVTKDEPVTDIRFYPNDSDQLMLSDLEKLFGKSEVFYSSKTTGVQFEKKKTKGDRDMLIQAELYFPPSKEPSPVLRVTVRLVSQSQSENMSINKSHK